MTFTGKLSLKNIAARSLRPLMNNPKKPIVSCGATLAKGQQKPFSGRSKC
jgi:hypothetical protein